jgi:DNA-binding CsgD family transcriptional regulator
MRLSAGWRASVPHYRRALELRRRFHHNAVEQQATLQALARSGMAVMVVAPDHSLLHASPRAEAVLRQADSLLMAGGAVTARLQIEADALRKLIDDAVCWSTGRVLGSHLGEHRRSSASSLAISRAGHLPLTVLVSPLRPPALAIAVPAAILFVRDPEGRTPSCSALRDLFGFTAAEAAVAAELAQGRSLAEVAQSQHVSMNTVRTHLKKVLAKTNTGRQAEAVTLIHRSVAMLQTDGASQIDA